MADPVLLGPDGRPIQRQALTQEVAVPTVTGVRQLFDEFVASGLTPARLGTILRDAATGDMHDFLTLAEEMEERETQYASVLTTRKRVITGIEPLVVAASEEAEDVEIADAVRGELVGRPDFAELVDDLQDALGKGYSAVEVIWRLTGSRWEIERFEHKDPRIFRWDRETRKELRLRVQGEPEGRVLDPYKFIVHVPRLKSGLPARNGLARLAVWVFLIKSFTLKDWAAFLEVHGMPLRLGKYGPAAGPAEKAVLLRAVRDLGSDAAAIIPQSMSVEFVESKGFSEKPFEGLASYCDKALSKAIIGQTMSADEGASGGLAQARVHDQVRADIKHADARQTAVTLNRDLVRPWVAFNYGPQRRYPAVVLPVTEAEDVAALAKVLESLIDRGLEIEMAEVRDRMGFREPKPKAVLMRPAVQSSRAEPPIAVNARFRTDACPGCGTTARATNAAEPDGKENERDRLAAAAADDWERVATPMVEAIRAAAARASNFAEFELELDRLAASLPVDALADRLAITAMKARGLGDLGEGT